MCSGNIFCVQYLLETGDHKGVHWGDELVGDQFLLPGVQDEGEVEEGEDTDPEHGGQEQWSSLA